MGSLVNYLTRTGIRPLKLYRPTQPAIKLEYKSLPSFGQMVIKVLFAINFL